MSLGWRLLLRRRSAWRCLRRRLAMVYPGRLTNLSARANLRQCRGKHFGGERVGLADAIGEGGFLDGFDSLDLDRARMDERGAITEQK